MRPTLRQLEYVVAVADHLNFRRAAEACLVSQPGLSTQVMEAEKALGVRLFERNRRRVLVTAVGERIVERARAVLRDVDEMVDLARSASAPLTGELRLGVIPTIAPYLLPRVLPAVRRAFPGLRLILREDRTARLARGLADGELDLLLLALPVDLGDARTLTLFREPFVLAAREGDPLLGASEVGADDLADRDVLLLEDGHCLREHALAVCRLGGRRDAAEIRGTSLTTLVQMVANGFGVTLLPELAVPAEIPPDGSVRVRPFAAPVPTRAIGLAYRRTSARREEFEALGEVLTRAEAESAGRPV